MKSFIATPVLQNKSAAWLIAIAVVAALASSFLGYWLGSSNQRPVFTVVGPVDSQSSQLPPVSVIEASVQPEDQANKAANTLAETPTNTPADTEIGAAAASSAVSSAQLSQTVGRLHADILTLRMLYRRLAEDAGIDLTDFELDDARSLPTEVPDAGEELGKLQDEIDQIKESSSALGDWYELRRQERVFELTGPVVMRGDLSSRFGWRKSPFTEELGLHKGVDYSGQVGEPVLALADGVVSFAGVVHAYGNMVELLHADGMKTRYAHNHSNSVSLGQRVEQGQIIAKLGSTGRSTGPHVHVEVHLNGEAVDPMLFIQ